MRDPQNNTPLETPAPLERLISLCMHKRVLVYLLTLALVVWGILAAPFDISPAGLFRSPVPVDAIPDIGENQQIIFTDWDGRSATDVENQISYPLTVSLLGIPGVKTIRSISMFGFSSVYIIFKDDVEFYWARARLIERLNSLPAGTLPEDVRPALGPDATALGQVYWYTLEGRDKNGNPTGGWDPQELRTIQDWYVRYGLLSAEGVSEVASVGGFVREYQIDVDPDLMRAYGVGLDEVVAAIRGTNSDVGAGVMEVNKVEYVVRGIGFVKALEDLQQAVIKVANGIPVYIKNVATVTAGPALRRGALDKGGAEAAGGIVVVRFGENPLAVIKNVKKKIEEISPGLPKKTLADGTVSQVQIIPFYDRAGLIQETLDTLRAALTDELLVTILVIIVITAQMASSLLIALLLPLSVLICFILMKVTGVSANIMALSGIAIAIGTLDDMGIIITENIRSRLAAAGPAEDRLQVVLRAAGEVGSAVLTAITTTIVGFLPVFFMSGAEGKLFQPLAFTKTYVLFASLMIALFIIPPLAYSLLTGKPRARRGQALLYEGLLYAGAAVAFLVSWPAGLVIAGIGVYRLVLLKAPEHLSGRLQMLGNVLAAGVVLLVLTSHWTPLGPERGFVRNLIFVAVVSCGLLFFFRMLERYYRPILSWCLSHKAAFLSLPIVITCTGALVWLGFATCCGWMPGIIKRTWPMSAVARAFPGLGKEFMPPLEEGAYLFMPSTMPHASIGAVMDILQKQDTAIQALPEVEMVVGKLGRAESALDPAPVPMIETVINYWPEYITGREGALPSFRFDPDQLDLARDRGGRPLAAPDGRPYLVRGRFARDESQQLIPDADGRPFRQWRPALDPALNPGRAAWEGIRRPDDIWAAIVAAARIPGVTSSARLQPISARIVMLQSGIRAAMAVKVTGPTLEAIQDGSLLIEKSIREVAAIDPATVIADRSIGKPYLEIRLDREKIGRYGITVQQAQEVIEFAVGGRLITTTVENRERYPVRVRYLRELRDNFESLGKILVPAPGGVQVPLSQLADIVYVRGPEIIKGENGFMTGYVLFDKKTGIAEVNAVEQAQEYLEDKLAAGALKLPPGVNFSFTGSYENQVRSVKTLQVIVPLALFIIFLILYFQFNSTLVSGMVFSGIFVAGAGGFIMLWLYAQPWFLNFSVFDVSMRNLFQVHPINLSVAVWVGFLALFGIASDDGVVMATYLQSSFANRRVSTIAEIRQATIEAGLRRIRPCLMTTATTIIALVPVLTSLGRGSDVMIPMAIPSFGGMIFQVSTMLIVPVLYCAAQEYALTRRETGNEK
jgi:Cu(I)/Ag(I) efflux system membrane protein CusA/SilA